MFSVSLRMGSAKGLHSQKDCYSQRQRERCSIWRISFFCIWSWMMALNSPLFMFCISHAKTMCLDYRVTEQLSRARRDFPMHHALKMSTCITCMGQHIPYDRLAVQASYAGSLPVRGWNWRKQRYTGVDKQSRFGLGPFAQWLHVCTDLDHKPVLM